jgi:lysozyme
MVDQALLDQLVAHEGLRLKPYRDTVGKLTIGVGRNLDDVGISKGEALGLLSNDVERVMEQLDQAIPWWAKLDGVRRAVLIDMGFNMGLGGLLGFKQTLSAVQSGDYQGAADGLLASKWATQVGQRAQDLARMMRTGVRA